MTGRGFDPRGTTPWDQWNGARVGGIIGAIVAVIVIQFLDPRPFWVVLVGAIVGAIVGYAVERRKWRSRNR